MNINPVGHGVERSIMEMGNLLKDMAAANAGLEKKMTSVAVAEQVSNCGSNIDLLA